MDRLSDNLLNKLYEMNYSIRYDNEINKYIIDVKAVPNGCGGLRFKCPFCMQKTGSINGYKANGVPYRNSKNLYHNHGSGYGTRSNHCSPVAKHFFGLHNKNYEFNLCSDISYVANPFAKP
jgi:hypothetical protein